MAELNLRNLDDRLVRSIQRRARDTGVSIDQSAGELLSLGLRAASELRTTSSGEPGSETDHFLKQRELDGVASNELSPEEALRMIRELRAQLGDATFPDSTPGIRTDRDTR